MKLASLFSGGKDSTFAIYNAKKSGHDVKCLISIFPISDESKLLHYHNIKLTKLQAEAMSIPHICLTSNSLQPTSELKDLGKVLIQAKNEFHIEGMVHGGILSNYQKNHFSKICSGLDLSLFSPLWEKDPKQYMTELLESKFRIIIVSVSAEGLDDSWLGKEITSSTLNELENLSSKHGFNLNFEGGEAETFVIDCPLFSHPIKIENAKKTWDGYRGRFEIVEAKLDNRAR